MIYIGYRYNLMRGIDYIVRWFWGEIFGGVGFSL